MAEKDNRMIPFDRAHIALNIIEQITKQIDSFTPQQRIFAEFVLQNPESIAFLSITELAKKAEVSEATIVRFCNSLGYDGFAQLSREIQQDIQNELSTAGRFQLVHNMKAYTVEGQGLSSFERVITSEIENLTDLIKSIKSADFYRCIDMMAKADRITIIGCMGSSCLAIFFGYTLAKIFPHVDVINDHTVNAHAIINSLNDNSLVFLISFPRYPKKSFELGRIAAQRGAKIIAITNSHISPVVPLANLSFFIPVGIPSYVDAYAAPVTFIHTLISEFSEKNPEITAQRLKQFDEYASEMDLFLKSKVKGKPKNKEE
ncbi:MAG: MurR/RpiR family transcriptional regulator [Deltaproteobacteria bacterium]|nr:MurR/RpiR family transcriptional regulator [Deltaproteobacteria bacterium]